MLLALFIAVVIGSIAGLLVAELVRETGFGLLGNVLIGIAGASIAALMGLRLIHGLDSWAAATAIGAVSLPLVAYLIKRVLSFAARSRI